jgi:hypothetical protein
MFHFKPSFSDIEINNVSEKIFESLNLMNHIAPHAFPENVPILSIMTTNYVPPERACKTKAMGTC